MTQAESILLSLLGPRPVTWRNSEFPDVLVSWNGMCMTQNHALMLAESFFWNQQPTPEMRFTADRRLLLIYCAGAFENSENWRKIIEEHAPHGTMHQWYERKLRSFIKNTLKDAEPMDVFSWFNLAEWATE